jgi:hypothetical protein
MMRACGVTIEASEFVALSLTPCNAPSVIQTTHLRELPRSE